jgi:hypothetical protein
MTVPPSRRRACYTVFFRRSRESAREEIGIEVRATGIGFRCRLDVCRALTGAQFSVFTACTNSIVFRLIGRFEFVDRQKNSIEIPLIRQVTNFSHKLLK